MKKCVDIYWLIPAEPYRGLFRKLIRILATQLAAPTFEPHLTLCHSKDRQLIDKARSKPIRLRVRGLAFSAKYTKTVFVRFHSNRALRKLVVDLGGKTIRDPHVSLIYKRLPTRAKRELAATIKLPFGTVRFNAVKLVNCASPTETRRDVESWRVVASKGLRR